LSTYADTSFLVSIYLIDRHSSEAQRAMAESPAIWFTPFHYAEWSHAIAQHIFQKEISAEEAEEVHRNLAIDRAAGLWIEAEVPENLFVICAELARQYCSRLGVRTLDSLHVACALELKAERFWTFDERQAKLAKAMGLKK